MATTSSSSSKPSDSGKPDGDSAVAQAAEIAHDTVDKAAAALAKAEQRLIEAKAAAGDKAAETSDLMKDISADTLASARRYINENPGKSVAIAFAAGFLVSMALRK